MADIYVRNDKNKVVLVDSKHLPELAHSTYKVMSPQEVFDYVREKEVERRYGSAGEIAKTAAIDFGHELTIGASTAMMGAMDALDKAELEERREAAGGWSTASRVAGFLAPAIASGGSAILAKGGLATAAKAGAGAGRMGLGKALAKAGTAPFQGMVKTGQLAEKVAAKGLSGLAAKGTAGKALAEVGTKAFGSMAEGAYYGTGQLLSETSFGDVDMNADLLWSTLGMNTLAGGVFGGGLNIAGQGLKAGFKGGSIVAKEIADRAKKIELNADTMQKLNNGYDNLQQIFTGVKMGELNTSPELRKFIGDKVTPALIRDAIAERLTTMHNNSTAISYAANNKLPGIIRKEFASQPRLKAFDGAYPVGKVNQAFAEIATNVRQYAQILDDLPNAGTNRTANELKAFSNEMLESMKTRRAKWEKQGFKASDEFADIWDFKRYMNDIEKKITRGQPATPANAPIANAARGIANDLDQLLKNERIWGPDIIQFVERWNKSFHTYLRRTKLPEHNKMWFKMKHKGIRTKDVKGSPKYVDDTVLRINHPNHKLRNEFLDGYLDDSVFMANGLDEVIPFDPKIKARIKQNNQAANEIKLLRDEGIKIAKVQDHFDDIRNAQIQSSFSAEAALAGSFIGGPWGAVAGYALGQAAKPANIIMIKRALDRLKQQHANHVGTMAWLESTVNSVGNAINDGVNFAVRGGRRVQRMTEPLGARNMMQLVNLNNERTKRNESISESYERVKRQMDQIMANPEHSYEQATDIMTPISVIAPEIGAKNSAKLLNAIAYVHKEMPSTKENAFTKTKIPASDTEIHEVSKIMYGAFNPLAVMEDVVYGAPISAKSVKAVKDLHPKMYEHFAQQAFQAVIDAPNGVSYETAQRFSVYFGIPAHAAFDAQNMLYFHENNKKISEAEKETGPGMKVKSGGSVGSQRSHRSYMQQHLTPTQKLEVERK